MSQPFDLVYPPADASIPILTVNLSSELRRRGFDVTVYAPRKNAGLTHQVSDGVQYCYVSERGSGALNRFFLRLSRRWSSTLPFFASQFSELRYALEVAVRTRGRNTQVVHVHNFTHFVPVIKMFNPQARFVLHMHCEWLSDLNRDAMRRRMAATDLVLGCSGHITRTIQTAFPDSASRVGTLFNGVDTDFFSPAPERPNGERRPRRLLFVGRVSPEKGVHDLIDAFVEVAARMSDVVLEIVGPTAPAPRGYLVDLSRDERVRRLARFYDIEEREGLSYLEQVKALVPPALEGRVRFVGAASRDTILRCYREADVLVNPSLSESFGMTVAEAMACGIPVVATRVGGMVDVVSDGTTGLLVEPARPGELAPAMCRLLADAELAKYMGRRARERALGLFSWKALGAQLASAYERLLPFAPGASSDEPSRKVTDGSEDGRGAPSR